MNFLILNTDYLEFLNWLYAQQPNLGQRPYEEQMNVRNESLFSTADFYSSSLRRLGHAAWDIHANNEWMQKTWAKEQGVEVERNLSIAQKYVFLVRGAASLASK